MVAFCSHKRATTGSSFCGLQKHHFRAKLVMDSWIGCIIKILLRVLQEIGKLTVVFGNGKLSQESSFSLMHTYVEQIAILSDDLAVWQDQYIDNFAIDLDASKRRKQGIEGVVTNITGVIKDDWRYAKLEEGLTVKIKQQMTPDKIEWKSQETDLYQKDLQFLIKDGKTYLWLPEEIS